MRSLPRCGSYQAYCFDTPDKSRPETWEKCQDAAHIEKESLISTSRRKMPLAYESATGRTRDCNPLFIRAGLFALDCLAREKSVPANSNLFPEFRLAPISP